MTLTVVIACMKKDPQIPARGSGQALWTYITKTSPYTGWELWPGKGKFYEGTEPHGILLTTYANDVAQHAVKYHLPKYPDGSIIVKENYTPAKTLAAVTVMQKIKGYNPSAGDWFWVKYGPDGTIMKEGKVGGCIKCHTDAKKTDYVFTAR
jgi:hypothetical protein